VTYSIHDNSVSYTFDNLEEAAQAVFVHGFFDGVEYVTGSLNWGSAGRHFKLEICSDHTDCFTWSEIDTNNWVKEAEPKKVSFQPTLTQHDQALLDLGRADTTTPVNVSITVYTDQTFRKSFNSDAELAAFVNLAISETNQGYANSKIPINMYLKCLLDTPSADASDSETILYNFLFSAKDDYKTFRRGADVTVLLSNSYSDNCGIAFFDQLEIGQQTFGTVSKGCATGYYSFGHEIAHMVGAHHNKETGVHNPAYPTGYGFLMKPPSNSGYRTILGYPAEGYNTRINYYSNPAISYNNVPTGKASANNAGVLTERRFLMAAVGDESLTCDL